ncbi:MULTISPECIES: hypothetical protein [Burkholderia]|uniref:hypothetical protein n=1 Tax=Burkholderia TaxID=32008 RepID=UPI0009313E79|nr:MULTISPECIES: hypothetical protein [Burkholderia]
MRSAQSVRVRNCLPLRRGEILHVDGLLAHLRVQPFASHTIVFTRLMTDTQNVNAQAAEDHEQRRIRRRTRILHTDCAGRADEQRELDLAAGGRRRAVGAVHRRHGHNRVSA